MAEYSSPRRPGRRGGPAPARRPAPAPSPAAPPALQGPPGGAAAARSQEVFVPPPVDIYEDEQGLVVVADLPGVAPGALDVRVDQGVLTLQGRTQALATGTPLHREYELTGFFRQFQFPEEIETGRIQAALTQGVLTQGVLTQGVLTLRLPRAAPAPPRRIDVRPA